MRESGDGGTAGHNRCRCVSCSDAARTCPVFDLGVLRERYVPIQTCAYNFPVTCSRLLPSSFRHLAVSYSLLPDADFPRATLPPGSAKDIDLAVAAAREAFKTTWGKNVSGVERSRLLNKLADLIERDAEELGALEALNNGKPFRIARCVFPSALRLNRSRTPSRSDFDVGDSVACLRYYAGWADKIVGQVCTPCSSFCVG